MTVYILQGLSSIIPGFDIQAQKIHPMLLDNTLQPETIWMKICIALDSSVTESLLVVLDDLHTVADRPDIASAVMYFIAHFPTRVSLVLISRQLISKKKTGLSLSRLRVQQRVLDITESDLEFTAGGMP